jgi:hypothetical protein
MCSVVHLVPPRNGSKGQDDRACAYVSGTKSTPCTTSYILHNTYTEKHSVQCLAGVLIKTSVHTTVDAMKQIQDGRRICYLRLCLEDGFGGRQSDRHLHGQNEDTAAR